MHIEQIQKGVAVFLECTLYIFLAIFPFFIFKSFLYQGSSSRFLLLTLASAIIAILLGIQLLRKRSRVRVLVSPISIMFGIYLLYLFVAALLGVDFAMSFWSRAERTSGLFYVTHLVPFVLYMTMLLSQKESREKILNVLFVSSGVYSICALLGNQGLHLLFKSNPYEGFLFGNSSFAAMYLLAVFFLSLYRVLRKKNSERRWFDYLIPAVLVLNPYFFNIKIVTGQIAGFSDILGVAQASSISLILGLAVLFGIFIISKIKTIRVRNAIAIGATVLALTVLSLGVSSLLSTDGMIRKAYETRSTLARPVVWEISKEAIAERPITGWGGDNFTRAFQSHFDNRLLEQSYGNEPWFDRAHNVVLDQTVDTGYAGVILYFALYGVLIGCLLYVVLRAKTREDIVLGAVLMTYFFVHMLELQTAFDTTISMMMGMIMVAFAMVVFENVRAEHTASGQKEISTPLKYVLGIVFVGYFGWALVCGTIPFWRVQYVNGLVRTVGNAEKRIPLYPTLFGVKTDPLGMVWRVTTDFQRGISENPSILENPERAASLLKELDVFTAEYEKYIAEHPESFRAHLNLADMYIFHMLFGVNMLDKVDPVLDKALALNPAYPQPYWMKSVAALYRRDFPSARKNVAEALKINPNAVETLRLQKYIEDSIKTFPEIDLYFFNQI